MVGAMINLIDGSLLSAIIDIQKSIKSSEENPDEISDYNSKILESARENLLKRFDISARCVYFNEKNIAEHLKFADNVVGATQHYSISENYVSHISQVGAQFDVLFVCSNDPRRAAKLFRSYRPILKRKTNIVVMAKSTPADRALLLTAGFDDVFDLKTDPGEAQLRILSYHRRRRNADPLPTTQQILLKGSIEAGMLKAKLTPTEGVVFSRLVEARQRPVPLIALCSSGPRGHPRTRMTSARVLLSRIRKKLGPGLAIICQGSAGYALVQTEGLQARWSKTANR